MPAERILFATDFSKQSDAAGRYAMSLARDTGAFVLSVHVIELPPPYGVAGPYAATFVDQNEQVLKGMLDEIVPKDCTIEDESHLLVGDPASEIVRVAEQESVDLIVLGTHGRTGLSRLLMGSVAEAVVRRARCAVLTVKQPEKVAAGKQS